MHILLARCVSAWAVVAVVSLASADEQLVLVAGGGDGGDGSQAATARFNGPFGVAFDDNGTMYVVELAGNCVRRIGADGVITTIAGAAGKKGYSGDGAPAAKADLNGPHSLVVDKAGDIYVADTWNNRVRKIDVASGLISTVAGGGEASDAASAIQATDAKLGGIYCIAFDRDCKRLYLADLDSRKVRVLDVASGELSTVAGNGERGVPSDGALAVDSPLVDPRAVTVDSRGNVYILERGGHALRVVTPDGRIRTVAGNGKKGAKGDGGAALAAEMNGPKHLCVDGDDNVIIADAENHLIRKYAPSTGMIERVAGSGEKGTVGLNGSPLDAQLNRPHGVCVDEHGVLFITDSMNDRILKIAP